MSQLTGGRTDKFGNAFERHWVVLLALDVVSGRAASVRWEPLGPEGAGVDVETTSADGTLTKYQCKSNNGTDGTWSAADLANVLRHAKAHLEARANTMFQFVSGHPASTLRSLVERARTCDNNALDFQRYCLSTTSHRREYASLCAAWKLRRDDMQDAQRALELLQRLDFKLAPEPEILHRIAGQVAEGEGVQIVASLGEYLEKKIGNTLCSDHLRAALRELGHPPRDLGGDRRVSDGIERLHVSFQGTLQPYLIGNDLISRPEAKQLVERVCAPGGARLVFVTGDAGSGKSGVLLEALQMLGATGVPYLPIRLDTHYPDRSVLAFSKDCLGLPASPGICLNVQAAGRRAVLVIDQLDAVRWTSANSDAAWERCKEIIDEALDFPNMTVVVTGRTVDLDDDPRIDQWTKGKMNRPVVEVQRFNIGPLPDPIVATVVARFGIDYASVTARERSLLSNAQNLQLWWRLAVDGKELRFASRTELLRSFWQHYRDKAVRVHQVPTNEIAELFEHLVHYLDTNGRLDAPSVLLDEHDRAVKALRALGIIDDSTGRVRFAHQSHLDYLTIERVLRRTLMREITPIDWLKGHDQSLFRRDQVRFLLQLLRHQDPALYHSFLGAVFFGSGVRFHIQHLVLTTLAQVPQPTAEEHALVKRLFSMDDWRLHVLERLLARHPPWLDAFTAEGTIPRMLASSDSTERDRALFLCYRSADVAPAWFERVLAPHWESGDPAWADRIGRVLAHDGEHDTPTVFQWRLARARAGADDPQMYNAERLAAKDQSKALAYLAATVEGLISNVERATTGDEQRRVEVESERFKKLIEACGSHPREAWDALMPIFKRSVSVQERLAEGEFNVNSYEVSDSANHIVVMLHDFLVTAGGALLLTEGARFLFELRALGQSPATGQARKLATDVLALAAKERADEAIDVLLTIDNPFDINFPAESMTQDDTLSPQDPARRALRALSSTCSAEPLLRIEAAVLSFQSENERRTLEWQREEEQDGGVQGRPNHYGLSQYALLLALPEERISAAARSTLEQWRNKFGDLSKYRTAGPVGLLPVVSPIPQGKARLVSSDEWVQIVSETGPTERGLWREVSGAVCIERSPATFASSLEEAGQAEPGRYVKLGLRFPRAANEAYYDSLLRVASLATRPGGVQDESWSPAPVQDVEALFLHIAPSVSTNTALTMCRVVAERGGENWSESTREMIRQIALGHPQPDGEALPESMPEEARARSIEMECLNAARPCAIRAVAQLLWAHPDLLDWARRIAHEAATDAHPAVRAAVMELAYAIGRHDLDEAVRLLVRAYEDTDPAVLAAWYGPYLVRAVWRREREVTPILQRAMECSDEKAAELGAYWSTVGDVVAGAYTNLARAAAAGSPRQRVGVVRALTDVAQHEEHREACLAKLAPYMSDEADIVLDAVDLIFRRDGFLNLKEAPVFAREFARSAAFRRDPTSLLHSLEEHKGSLLPFADAIEASVAQLSGELAFSTQSMANRNAMAGRDIATVLLRLYQQAEAAADAELRKRCLDQWDALLKFRVGTGQEVLSKIDGATDQ